MRAAVPWSRYQLDLTRSPLILLSMPQHNATHTHADIHTLESTLATLCHQASAQPSNSSSRAKMAPEPFFCPWRARSHTKHTHTQKNAADGHWTAWPQCHLPVPCTRSHDRRYRLPSLLPPSSIFFLSIYFCIFLSCLLSGSLYHFLLFFSPFTPHHPHIHLCIFSICTSSL